ncbi:MAG: hypothetical protein E7557_01605 [Ruminococcaceae bacterium]|nr:hypothetical protein [Oscillospiraceae bacterium]
MTASEVLEIYNLENQNDVSEKLKKLWISELDKKIVGELNKGRENLRETYYTPESDISFKLNAPTEYSEIYLVYLKMKTDYLLGETGRYNNSAMIFNRLYFEMSNFISRNFKTIKNNSLKVELNNA